MMNHKEGKAIQTIDPTHPAQPNLEFPHFAIDSANPLAWVLVITMFLTQTNQTIALATHLIRAIAALKQGKEKRSDRKGD